MRAVYGEIVKALDAGKAYQILISVFQKGNTESVRKPKYYLDTTGFLSPQAEQDILLSGKPQVFETEDALLFVEPFYGHERIIVIGGGHIALSLTEFASKVGFYVVVVDDRAEFAQKERFPLANEVICSPYEVCMSQIKPQKNDYVVIATRGYAQDKICLENLLQYEECIYTGVIGSSKKMKLLMTALIEMEQDPQRLARICSPIGLSIGAVTTEEISIAILAEIIKRKRVDSKGLTAISRSDTELKVVKELAACQMPCALATIMSSQGSSPRKAGAKMIIFPDGRISGSIGGGIAEASMIELGRKIIGSGSYTIEEVDLHGKDLLAQGMICGGSIQVLLEDIVL